MGHEGVVGFVEYGGIAEALASRQTYSIDGVKKLTEKLVEIFEDAFSEEIG